jgi:hypothetical protein
MLRIVSWSRGLRGALERLWQRWTPIAHAIGNFQARVLLTIFYLAIAAPFALAVKLLADPLTLKSPAGASYWVTRPERPASERSATRQF